MGYGSDGPPAEAVRQTDETREAAVAELAAQMGEDPSQDPENLDGGTAGDSGTPITPDDGVEPDSVDSEMLDLASDILSDSPKPATADRWEDRIKTDLVAAGLGEQAAHTIAYKSGRANAEKVLAGLSGVVPSEPASSESAPAGGEDRGTALSDDLLDQLDGSARKELGSVLDEVRASARQEVASLREEMDFLRGKTADTDAAALARRLVDTRNELSGAYPELNTPGEWDRVKPMISAAMQSGLARDGAEALRLAAIRVYGVRASDPGTPSQPVSGTLPRGRNAAAGSNAATPDTAKAALAHLIFSGASSKAINEASKTYRGTL